MNKFQTSKREKLVLLLLIASLSRFSAGCATMMVSPSGHDDPPQVSHATFIACSALDFLISGVLMAGGAMYASIPLNDSEKKANAAAKPEDKFSREGPGWTLFGIGTLYGVLALGGYQEMQRKFRDHSVGKNSEPVSPYGYAIEMFARSQELGRSEKGRDVASAGQSGERVDGGTRPTGLSFGGSHE
jgi:hypothetical protein